MAGDDESGDGAVIYDRRAVMPSGAIVEVFARRADPGEYAGGVKYRLHYGFPVEDHPIVRYDNAHGHHERHEGEERTEIEFPGAEELRDRFLAEVTRHERTHDH